MLLALFPLEAPNQSAWHALRTIRAGFCEAGDLKGFSPQEFFNKVLHPGMLATVKVRGSFMSGFYREIGPEGKPVDDPGLDQSAQASLLWRS